MPYVAAGRVAAYVVSWVDPLHCAAGALLVTEAGGSLSDLWGEPWSVGSDSIVASANAELHAQLLGLGVG